MFPVNPRVPLSLGLLVALCNASLFQQSGVMVPLSHRQADAPLALSNSWHVLGPFQIGTREATWGADPLEYVGGFRSLQYDPDAQFRSSLPANGTAKWTTTEATKVVTLPTSVNASLSISHSNVDWDFLKVVYGWAAVQYQSWARGELVVRGNETQSLILYSDAILEYWVDDVHYFGGDFFTFRKAPPVLHLTPGAHRIDLRLVRDVRAFGGILAPTIDVVIHAEQASGTLELAKPGILMSAVVDGKLAAPAGSITLRNSGTESIEVIGIQSSPNQSSSASPHLGTVLAPGQTRPIAFDISLPTHNVSSIQYTVSYKTAGSSRVSTLHVSQELVKTSVYEPHKITYLHPGGIVSYAMLRPPARNATCGPGQNSSLPVLMALHGAGLEADSKMVTQALHPVADLCAWVLFPTGVTPWSGDDWHNWGFTDVEAAVNSIPDWINNVGWQGPRVDINRWIVSGHSNGGQGTWYALTHRADKILAAAPVSGYASIQKYVPYELWQPADPRRTAVISAALNSYRHEMLMPNARGIPLQQQHGQIDDNVPAYNSRFLAKQLFLSGTNSNYNEVPGQNHWWETVMTTPALVDFYYTQTKNNATLPRKLDEFEFVVGDPGDTGPKSGIRVLLLEDPGQYGRLHVKGHTITSSNILSLEFDPTIFPIQSFSIDGAKFSLTEVPMGKQQIKSSVAIYKSEGTWLSGSLPPLSNGASRRYGRQLGSMTAILRTQGPFIIKHQGLNISTHLALQISRNLHQYFQADANTVVLSSREGSTNQPGNIITLILGDDVLPTTIRDFPLRISSTGITVHDSRGREHIYDGSNASIAAAFLRPLDGERLELILWGSDTDGLAQAARLVPMVTGVGQPDFVVLGESARWKGVDGALALGFLDHEWKVTPSSVVT